MKVVLENGRAGTASRAVVEVFGLKKSFFTPSRGSFYRFNGIVFFILDHFAVLIEQDVKPFPLLIC